MKPQAVVFVVLLAILGVVSWLVAARTEVDRPKDAANGTSSVAEAGDGSEAGQAARVVEALGARAADAEQGDAIERTEAVRTANDVADAAGDAKVELRGRVVDEAGAAKPDLAVGVRIRRGFEGLAGIPGVAAENLEVTTDREGRFAFRLPRQWSSELRLRDQEQVFAKAATFEGYSADHDLGDLVAIAASSIAGVVQDASGAPVADIQVRREAGVSLFSAAEPGARTDAEGRFALAGLRPGKHVLSTASSRFVPKTATVELAAGERIAGYVLTLDAGFAVSGRVLDERGIGIAGAKVASLRRKSHGAMEIERYSDDEAVTTDAQGRFRLAGLADDKVTLRASAKGHSEAKLVDASTRSVGLELRLQRLGGVAGVLVQRDGTPIAGSRVWARSNRNGAFQLVDDLGGTGFGRGMVQTDAEGRFELTDVKPGSVTVAASGNGHLPVEQKGVRVSAAQIAEGVRLIADAGALARVLVVDDEGNPVANARVEISSAPQPSTTAMGGSSFRIETAFSDDPNGAVQFGGQRVLGRGETDSAGVASIGGLPAGDAVAVAKHDRFAPSTITRLTLPEAGAAEARLVVAEPGYVDVAVMQSEGMAEPLRKVALQQNVDGQVKTVESGKTDAAGKLRFGPLRPGRYTAVLAHKAKPREMGNMALMFESDEGEIASSAKVVDLAAGKSVAVELLMPVLTELTGKLFGSDGPVAGGTVELHKDEDDQPVIAGLSGKKKNTRGDGSYSFEGLEAGAYTLRFGKPEQRVLAESSIVIPANTASVARDLRLVCGTVRVQALSKDEAEPVEDAEVSLTRMDERAPGAAGDGEVKPRERRVVMVGITMDGDSGGTTSMTFGEQAVRTDEEGKAVFEDVPVGTYELKVKGRSYAPFSKSEVVVVRDRLTDVGLVELVGAGQIRGRVLDADGGPAMGLVGKRLVGAEDWDAPAIAMQGSYRIESVAAGRYEMRCRSLASSADDWSEIVVVDVVTGRTAVQEFTIEK